MTLTWPAGGPLFGLGAAALLVGERALAGGGQAAARGLAAAALAGCLVWALARVRAAAPGRRAASRAMAGAWGQAVGGLALVAVVQAPAVAAALADAWPRLPTLALLAGLALAAWGAMAAAAGEWALAGMRPAPNWEVFRLARSMQAARTLVACVIAFAALNYTASVWSRRIDVSYFRTTRVGAGVRARLAALTTPLHVVTFFPPGNEVADALEAYLAPLAAIGDQVVREKLDHAVDVERASALAVRANGALVVEHEGRHSAITLGLDIEGARGGLRDLDARVLRAVAEVTRARPVIYATAGHHERDLQGAGDDGRAGIAKLRRMLEAEGMIVKPLGLAEGLGERVPADATVVMSIGALAPVLAAELAAIDAYLGRGGRLLLAQDPDLAAPDDALAGLVGARVGRHLIAHDRYLVRFPQRRSSPYDLVTTALGVHPVARTLQRHAGQAAVVLLGAGAVATLPGLQGPAAPREVLRAMPGAWDDRIANGRFDGPPETQAAFVLVAAVERPPPAAPAGAAPGAPLPPARAVVMGDAEMVADGIIDNPGNAVLAGDALRWLMGEVEGAGPTVESERDITVVQRRDQDAVWFWGVVFGAPALVVVGGLVASRRRSRPPRRGAS